VCGLAALRHALADFKMIGLLLFLIALHLASGSVAPIPPATAPLPLWSTASLSVPRADLAAASLPHQLLVLFAGGDQIPGFTIVFFRACWPHTPPR
jgi:hypothetical protein